MKKRLLVVEDNQDLADIYQLSFQQAGFEVLSVHDGEEALKKFVDFQPHLVLCDIKLPSLSGFDTIEMMQGFPELMKNTVIIIISAYSDRKLIKRAQQLGIPTERYLVKSQISINQVAQVLQGYIPVNEASTS
ncbi:MAG: response regulator [Candidatus Saccharibacteria bacterium]|nr:response regulator [Candidatus Saccharibacteria bacterium]MCY4089137.1 response regulator [Candidatus Saccharibacteria bacterium]